MATQAKPVVPDELRYPIGRFEPKPSYTSAEVAQGIDTIASTPTRLADAVRGLTDAKLDTPYRDGGWTVRQVVHHVPDSALNAYIRMKLALTEEKPTIKPYDENRWSELHDAKRAPVELSLRLFDCVVERWVVLLRSLSAKDLAREFFHPELNANVPLERLIAMYAWHGEHHTAHIRALRARKGW